MKFKTPIIFVIVFFLFYMPCIEGHAQHSHLDSVKSDNTKSELTKSDSNKSELNKPDTNRNESGTNLDSLLQALDYPELQVVPRASERLFLETNYEKDNSWIMYWPFHLSALSSLGAGLALNGKYKANASEQEKSDMDMAAKSAIAVGTTWFVLTGFLSMSQFYQSEWIKIKSKNSKDRADGKESKRLELYRERMSEEALERPAKLMKLLTWGAVLSNLIVTANLIDRSERDNNLYPLIGSLISFMPLLFTNRYIENYDKHLEYKRKIYAPISYIRPFHVPVASNQKIQFAPQLVMEWNF